MPLNRRSFLGASIAAAGLAQTPISLALSGRSALKFDDYRKLDALALAQGIRQGDFSAAEVLETAIVAAQRINPTINAIVEPLYD
jgi:amidase